MQIPLLNSCIWKLFSSFPDAGPQAEDPTIHREYRAITLIAYLQKAVRGCVMRKSCHTKNYILVLSK